MKEEDLLTGARPKTTSLLVIYVAELTEQALAIHAAGRYTQIFSRKYCQCTIPGLISQPVLEGILTLRRARLTQVSIYLIHLHGI